MFTLLIPVDGLRLYLRARKMPGAQQRWCERLAWYPDYPHEGLPIIWLHAVSLGEAKLSIPLVEALLLAYPQHRILMTTTTLTGSQIVQAHFQQRVLHRYFPYDVPWISRRFLKIVKPVLWIIIETELWPNHLRYCAARSIPVLLLNARLSQRSANRYRRIAPLLQAMWRCLTAVGAQTQADKERFIALGCAQDKITVQGNLKYELQVDSQLFSQAKQYRQQWGETRPVWIAASTHEGEEQIVLEVFATLRKTMPQCLLILVPRHPQRFAAVAQLLHQKNLTFVQRSDPQARANENTEVILVDTIGELNGFYAASDVAFVGGSLQPIGGHNIIEAAAYHCAVVTGPHTLHFKEIIQDFQSHDGVVVVADAQQLLAAISTLLLNPARRAQLQEQAQALIVKHHGVLHKNLNLINKII